MKIENRDDLLFIESCLNWYAMWHADLIRRLYVKTFHYENHKNVFENDESKHTYFYKEISQKGNQVADTISIIVMGITKSIFLKDGYEIKDENETNLILESLTTYSNLIIKVKDRDSKTPFFNGEQKLIDSPIGGSFEYDLEKCHELIDLIKNKGQKTQ